MPAAPAAPAPGAAAPAAPQPPSQPKGEQSFLERMGIRKVEKVETPKKPDAEPVKPGEKGAEGGDALPKPPAKPKQPKAAPVAQPATAPDYDKIAEASARGVAKALTETKKPDPKPGDDLDEETKETLVVLERMEKDFGPKYAGVGKKYAESVRKATAYQAEWEKANPGREFDPEDEEHNEFYEKNDVDWDDGHYTKAVARIEADKIVEAERRKSGDKVEEIERREKLREAMPAVIGQQVAVAKQFFGELGETFKDVLLPKGEINMVEVTRLTELDDVNQAVFQAAENVERFAGELHKLTLSDEKGNALYPFNDKDQGHRFIADFISQEEQRMMSLDPTEQVDDRGRRFATAEDYAAMTPAQQRVHWRFTDADLSRIYAAREADRVKTYLQTEEDRLKTRATKRGYVLQKQDEPQKQPPAGGRPNGADTGNPPASPSGVVAPMPAHATGGARGGNGNATSSFLQRWLGRG